MEEKLILKYSSWHYISSGFFLIFFSYLILFLYSYLTSQIKVWTFLFKYTICIIGNYISSNFKIHWEYIYLAYHIFFITVCNSLCQQSRPNCFCQGLWGHAAIFWDWRITLNGNLHITNYSFEMINYFCFNLALFLWSAWEFPWKKMCSSFC